MELPRSVKQLFKWCRYHMLVNPLVASVVRKMAAYPITEIVFEAATHEGFDKHKERWEDCLLRTLHIDQFQLEIGLDYQGYGNCIVSLLPPFKKYLSCQACKFSQQIKKLQMGKHWDFKDWKYILTCPRCGAIAEAKVEDVQYKSYKGLKLIRWNLTDIDIDYNPITRTSEYSYRVPSAIRARVVQKNRKYLEEMPHVIIKAMKEGRPFVLDPDNVYHFKAPTPSLDGNDEGWGYPPILPALKDSFYLQVMKKSQEAVMLEHLIPLDIIFPATSDANANPYMHVNLADWKARVEKEIIKWRWDPNYKPVMPVPIGYQRIGGNGRALMLTQEIRAWSEHIIAGMGVPQEFVFGGLSYSGSSVSLRMLENQFSNYRSLHTHFLQHWLIPKIARFMGWSEISIHLREFKMADDMQNKQLLISMNQMQKVSDEELLAEFGLDALEESRIIEKELRRRMELQRLQTVLTTEIQNEVQASTMKAQSKLQNQMMQSQGGMAQPMGQGDPSQGGAPESVNVMDLADSYAKKLAGMEPQEQAATLQRIGQSNPQLQQLISQKMGAMSSVDMTPLPEQRPPRRGDQLI